MFGFINWSKFQSAFDVELKMVVFPGFARCLVHYIYFLLLTLSAPVGRGHVGLDALAELRLGQPGPWPPQQK
jgi:hypothetical protein